jgi:hypothetical protein
MPQKLNISKVTTDSRHMVLVKLRHFEDGENKDSEIRVVYRGLSHSEGATINAALEKEATEREQLSRYLSMLVIALPDLVDDAGAEAKPTYEFFMDLDFTVAKRISKAIEDDCDPNK